MNIRHRGLFLPLFGLLLCVAGAVLLKNGGLATPLPYVLLGVGCGLFGQGAGALIFQKILQSAPETERSLRIERNDERNVTLANRAMAYDLMSVIFGALMVSFALMGVELTAVLLLVAAYLSVHGYAIWCRCKLEKEM